MMKHLKIRMHGRRALKTLAAALLVAAVSFAPSVALAHGGEDHGDEKPAVTSSSGPRIDAHSKDFELVGIPSAQDGGKLVVYLNKFWSNEAVTGAAIEMTRGDETVTATETKGVYAVKAPWVTTPGHYDLTFSITAGDQSDLLIGRLDIPAPLAAEPAHDSLWDHIIPHGTTLPHVPVWMLAGTLGLAVLLSLLAIKGPRAVRTAFVLAAAVSGLSTVAMAAVVLSNGARKAEEMAVIGRAVLDLPASSRRLEDGAVFVPKPTQRLLGIATVESAKAATVQKTVRLIGQVIPDPNRSGVVQSLLAGRIEPPEGGFPAVGAAVKKGDVLGYLVPAVAVVDQSDIAQTQGDLDKQIALLEAKLKRIEPLSGAAVPAGQITDTKIELDILRKRRAVIKPVLKDREDLRAPADGVLAQANVTAGQVVEAQSVLFQIVDPANLWIEALAFDAASADRIAQSGKDALAQTADGRKVSVSFAGRSPALRQQAVPLRFQIKRDGPALNVGESVTVHAATDEPVEAITLPRASVVRSSNGQPVVWAHVEAERFEARVVKTSPIDAERLGVTAGIQPGTRVVTRGAELINQVR
jgi:hypothetical protein